MTFGKSFHPPLFTAFPVLCIFSANLDLIPVAHLWRPLLLSVLTGVALWLLASLAWRDTDKGAVTASCLGLAVFAFSATAKAALHGYDLILQFTVWAVVALGLSIVAGWKVKWVGPLNVLATGCVLASLGQVGVSLARANQTSTTSPTVNGLSKVSAVAKPDIVNIILDGYGRSDQLNRAIGFDNRPFVEGLRSRGFYVADEAHSNYCQTELSIASSLNMDFIQELLPSVKPDSDNRSPLVRLIWKNSIAQTLRSRGYRFISVTTGFPPIQFEKSDLHLHDNEGTTWFESAVLQMTPLGEVPATTESLFDERRRHILDAFSNLQLLSARSASPRLVVAHILAPHPPFVFNPDGTGRPHMGPFGFWDGSDYTSHVGSPQDYRKGYAAQAEFLNKMTLETIDKLLETSGQEPVIILQGDHGSKVGLDQNSLEKTDLNECFSNLAAFYVPKTYQPKLYPTITPVNYYRVVFNAVFGDAFPLLPDRSWYSTYPRPFEFTDVTSRLVPAPDPASSKTNVSRSGFDQR